MPEDWERASRVAHARDLEYGTARPWPVEMDGQGHTCATRGSTMARRDRGHGPDLGVPRCARNEDRSRAGRGRRSGRRVPRSPRQGAGGSLSTPAAAACDWPRCCAPSARRRHSDELRAHLWAKVGWSTTPTTYPSASRSSTHSGYGGQPSVLFGDTGMALTGSSCVVAVVHRPYPFVDVTAPIESDRVSAWSTRRTSTASPAPSTRRNSCAQLVTSAWRRRLRVRGGFRATSWLTAPRALRS